MVNLTQEDLPYIVLTEDPNLQAYRTDRLSNVEQTCPADETGDLFCEQISYEPLLSLAPADGAPTRRDGGAQRRRDRDRGRVLWPPGRVPVLALAPPARGASRWSSRNEAPIRERSLAGRQDRRGAADARLRHRLQLLPLPGHGRPDRPARPRPQRHPGGDRQAAQRLRARQAAATGQFVDYLGDTATLDLGTSQRSRRSVWTEIKEALPWTLLLVGTGHAAGDADRLAGWGWSPRRGAARRPTTALLGFSLFTYAAPEYWIGIILILVFAVWIPILPAGLQMTPGVEFSSWFAEALDVAEHLILPATAMTLMLLGQYFLIMRSSMVDVLTEDFITVKRATGLPLGPGRPPPRGPATRCCRW